MKYEGYNFRVRRQGQREIGGNERWEMVVGIKEVDNAGVRFKHLRFVLRIDIVV